MATNSCATAKAPHAGSVILNPGLQSGQIEIDRQPESLAGYGLSIQAINSSVEHYGGSHDISIDMHLKSYGRDGDASTTYKKFESFLKDIEILSKVKRSDHPGVQEQWDKIQTLIALIDEDEE